MAAFLDRLETGRPEGKGRPSCVITFDDGFRDNYLHAFPILRETALPATVFLTAAHVGTGRRLWFDEAWETFGGAARGGRAAALARGLPEAPDIAKALLRSGPVTVRVSEAVAALKAFSASRIEEILARARGVLGEAPAPPRSILDWEEIGEMSRHGVSFGSHGYSHTPMTRLDAAEARREAVESAGIIARPGVSFVPVFAYPNGDHSPETAAALRGSGYLAAFTTTPGWVRPGRARPFALPRFNVSGTAAPDARSLSFHLSGLRALARRVRHG